VRDDQAAINAAGGDRALAAELFETLLAQLPAETDLLRSLLAESDWPGIDELAHRLRGASAYCGVPALDAALAELSMAAKTGVAARTSIAADRVLTEVQRLMENPGA
jgi:two-component system sensor histidine kinase BarA